MRIGYPCINTTFPQRGNKRFRLASYTTARLTETARDNISALEEIVAYNVKHGFFFFRISSDLVPFASHPVCDLDWAKEFATEFTRIGRTIQKHSIRISMHPDQFTLINSPDEAIFKRSVAELDYHVQVLESLGLDESAKIQIHVGGVYGDKKTSTERFIHRYRTLSKAIRERLVIENDERCYSLRDCLVIHEAIWAPILFDSFHHEILGEGIALSQALRLAEKTWKKKDGILMMDYSSQDKEGRIGKHTPHIQAEHFKRFLKESAGVDFDVMLEIKDKEVSGREALQIARQDPRMI